MESHFSSPSSLPFSLNQLLCVWAVTAGCRLSEQGPRWPRSQWMRGSSKREKTENHWRKRLKSGQDPDSCAVKDSLAFARLKTETVQRKLITHSRINAWWPPYTGRRKTLCNLPKYSKMETCYLLQTLLYSCVSVRIVRKLVNFLSVSWRTNLSICQSIYIPTLTYGHMLRVMTERTRFLWRLAGLRLGSLVMQRYGTTQGLMNRPFFHQRLKSSGWDG